MTTALKPFNCPESGYTLYIRRISPLLALQVQRMLESSKPQPPKQQVDFGDGREHWEENPADPAYLRALKAHDVKLEEATQALILDRGVEVELTDEDKEAVAELRAWWKTTYDVDLVGSDKYIFIHYIALAATEDLQAIMQAIMTKSAPTPGQVEAIKESFPGGVSQ